jgi:hypothetical protein
MESNNGQQFASGARFTQLPNYVSLPSRSTSLCNLQGGYGVPLCHA